MLEFLSISTDIFSLAGLVARVIRFEKFLRHEKLEQLNSIIGLSFLFSQDCIMFLSREEKMLTQLANGSLCIHSSFVLFRATLALAPDSTAEALQIAGRGRPRTAQRRSPEAVSKLPCLMPCSPSLPLLCHCGSMPGCPGSLPSQCLDDIRLCALLPRRPAFSLPCTMTLRDVLIMKSSTCRISYRKAVFACSASEELGAESLRGSMR